MHADLFHIYLRLMLCKAHRLSAIYSKDLIFLIIAYMHVTANNDGNSLLIVPILTWLISELLYRKSNASLQPTNPARSNISMFKIQKY